MTSIRSALDADWLSVCRRPGARMEQVLADSPTTVELALATGTQGDGGDTTLVIDQSAEDIVFAELDRLREEGHRFMALSEERGEIDYGDCEIRVIIDPIDGSLNAKRGISHHALSLAVADGPTMADVFFGFVQDFGPQEEWLARRGGGAQLDGVTLDRSLTDRRNRPCRPEVAA